ncbi:Eyes absent-like protein 4 [Trichoplax sp. H2]|nr:Eyes absent-like protein 4 [Trichoplax sp. H2]|eukprot:RDD47742.1 Eyes absent-like protein 4 [Trichoplax sp. H2]
MTTLPSTNNHDNDTYTSSIAANSMFSASSNCSWGKFSWKKTDQSKATSQYNVDSKEPNEKQKYSPTQPTSSTPPSSPEADSKNTSINGTIVNDAKCQIGNTTNRILHSPTVTNKKVIEKVYIWDLDETIIVFQSLLNGDYARKFSKDYNQAICLGYKIETLIFDLADSKFHFRELAKSNKTHIDDIDYGKKPDSDQKSKVDHWDKFCSSLQQDKVATYFKDIKEIYEKYRDNVKELVSVNYHSNWELALNELQSFTDKWIHLARNCIDSINSRFNSVNVIVTTTQLVPAAVKCLLYSIADLFPLENIYSATDIGKEQCFRRIMERYRNCQYFVIGDGKAEESASRTLNLPFWNISSHDDLFKLNVALNKNTF